MGERYFASSHPVLPVCSPTPSEEREIKRFGYRNGTEFLQFVQLEREKCFKTTNPKSKLEKKKVVIKLPIEQKKELLAEFLKKKSPLMSKMQEVKEQFPLLAADKFPKRNDMLGWCAFCLGMEPMAQIQRLVPNVHVRENDYKPAGYPPYLRLMINLNEATLIKLLNFLSTWLQVLGFSSRLGQWIYGVLMVFEVPVVKKRSYVALCEFLEVLVNHRRFEVESIIDAFMLDMLIYILKKCFHCKEEKSGITLRDRKYLGMGMATRKLFDIDSSGPENCS